MLPLSFEIYWTKKVAGCNQVCMYLLVCFCYTNLIASVLGEAEQMMGVVIFSEEDGRVEIKQYLSPSLIDFGTQFTTHN